MNMKKQVAVMATLLPIFLILLASRASASEGYIRLNSTTGANTLCHGFSVLMPSLDYEMLFACRDLVYPGSANQFNYVAWAQPTDGGSAVRLGTLGVGKVAFETNEAFNQIFVTSESNSRPRNPGSNVVLRGNVEQLSSSPTQPTPAEDNETNQTVSSPIPSPVPQRSFFSRLFQASSIIPFVGVVILLILVFILTRR